MNRDELLAQLRGIHLPPVAGDDATSGFALWPFVVFCVLAGIVAAVRHRRRTAWRRDAGAALHRIRADTDLEAQAAALAALAVATAKASGKAPPGAVYRRAHEMNGAERESLVDHIRAATAS